MQVTGALPGPPPPQARYYSAVFVASMDEGGGGLATRQNVMYRSMDGGVTWTSSIMGPRFNPPGDGVCPSNSYFAKMNPIWRHMGWGEPGVGPGGVVHYAYAAKGALSPGTSTTCVPPITAQTWSAPIKLNDPETNQYQDPVDAVPLRQLQPGRLYAGRQGNRLLVRSSPGHLGLQRCHRSGMQLPALWRPVA